MLLGMNAIRHFAMSIAFGMLAAANLHGRALAADFPSRPVRWIMPFPPGGPSDVVARVLAQRLGERLKQPVLVDNRAGASGAIGMEAAARAAPDGHTIVFAAPGTVVINPVLYKLNFDPLHDLAPVVQIATFSFVLLAHPDFPARTIQELLAAAKAAPGATTCGWGATLQQLACEFLRLQGDAPIRIIPYKGSAPAMTDLVAGQINFLFEVTNIALPQVKANRIRAIATTSSRRLAGPFGHLPTVAETLPGFGVEGWFGVLVPHATPRDVVVRLNHELAAVLEEVEVRKSLTDGGLEIAHGSPENFGDLLRRDHAKYSKIIRKAGIKAEGP